MTAMKRFFLISGLWALLAAGLVVAQQADESAEPESAVESEDSGEQSKAPERAPADDVFVPSERISADQEVIFPVDI